MSAPAWDRAVQWPEQLGDGQFADIIGQPCFAFIHFARLWRDSGTDIEPAAEAEQGFFIHLQLGLWFEHGPAWRDAFAGEIGRRMDIVRAKRKAEASAKIAEKADMNADAERQLAERSKILQDRINRRLENEREPLHPGQVGEIVSTIAPGWEWMEKTRIGQRVSSIILTRYCPDEPL